MLGGASADGDPTAAAADAALADALIEWGVSPGNSAAPRSGGLGGGGTTGAAAAAPSAEGAAIVDANFALLRDFAAEDEENGDVAAAMSDEFTLPPATPTLYVMRRVIAAARLANAHDFVRDLLPDAYDTEVSRRLLAWVEEG